MNAPLLSVIIPTCNRPQLLTRCLNSLSPETQCLSDAGVYEVIVSDDSITPSPTPPWVRWIAGPRLGPAANRNRGAHFANGTWLVFIDDDCFAATDYLHTLCYLAQSDQFEVIEGKTCIPQKRDSPFYHGVENVSGNCFWSCNLAINRRTFERLGGFDEDFLEAGGEDMELAYRIRQNQLKTVFAPKALVYHPMYPHTTKSFLHRIWLMRWHRLYLLKTNASVPTSASKIRILWKTLTNEIKRMLLSSWKSLQSIHQKNWKTTLFEIFWTGFTAPVLLPYLLYWELKFRKRCTKFN